MIDEADLHSSYQDDDDTSYDFPPLTKKRKIDHDNNGEDYHEARLSIERRKVDELHQLNENMQEQNVLMRELLKAVKQKLS